MVHRHEDGSSYAQNLFNRKLSGTLMIRLIIGAKYFEIPTFVIQTQDSILANKIPVIP